MINPDLETLQLLKYSPMNYIDRLLQTNLIEYDSKVAPVKLVS